MNIFTVWLRGNLGPWLIHHELPSNENERWEVPLNVDYRGEMLCGFQGKQTIGNISDF